MIEPAQLIEDFGFVGLVDFGEVGDGMSTMLHHERKFTLLLNMPQSAQMAALQVSQ